MVNQETLNQEQARQEQARVAEQQRQAQKSREQVEAEREAAETARAEAAWKTPKDTPVKVEIVTDKVAKGAVNRAKRQRIKDAETKDAKVSKPLTPVQEQVRNLRWAIEGANLRRDEKKPFEEIADKLEEMEGEPIPPASFDPKPAPLNPHD
jgi:hypothetical protein